MPDRLAELQRQRALLQEHLDWLDRELALERQKAGVVPSAPIPAPVAVTAPTAPPAPLPGIAAAVPLPAAASLAPQTALPNPAVDAQAEAVLEKYRVGPDTLKHDVRKGCFLYFIAGFVFLGAIIAALWFAFSLR